MYKNDVQEGLGKNITKEGKELIALYKDGKVVLGKSIMYYNEPNIDQMHMTIKYEGDYKNNKMEGKGILFFENGDKYEGEFLKDKFNGKGVYTWNDGNIYEGGFKDDFKEGKGKLFLNNGEVINALWKNGIPIEIYDT